MDSAKKKLAVMKARLTESLMEAERAETELAEKRKKAEQVKTYKRQRAVLGIAAFSGRPETLV